MSKFVLWLIISFFSTFSLAYLYYKLTDAESKINLKIFFVYLLGAIAVILIKIYDIKFLNYVFFFIYFPVFFYMLNHIPLKKLFFYVLVVWTCGLAIDILTILLTSFVLYLSNLSFNIYINNSEYISMFLTACVTIFLLLISQKMILNSFINKLYSKISKIKYLDFLLIIFALFIFLVGLTMFINIKSLSINLLLSVVMILMVITFALLVRYRIVIDENTKYLKTLKENNEFYIKMDDENRTFKHNLIAKLLSIKSVANEKTMVLIEDLIVQFNKSVDFSNSIKIIPYGLNGIIYQKLYPNLKKLNIKINNEINYDIFEVLKPRRYNVLVEKLVVTLDNAIESSLKSKGKSIVINIYDKNGLICIEIKNTFSNDINMDLLGSVNYSTKGKKRGLGLFSILRDNEASVSVKIVNNIFISKITTKKRLSD